MTLEEIAARLQRGVERHPMARSLKIDLREAGAIVLSGETARVSDDPADCTVSMTKDNFEKLMAGKLNPMTAFAMGRIKVSGDASVAMALAGLLTKKG